MNTTTAAATAGVTIPTIRTWCRTGVIAAVKQAGRWIINAASLAHRITIGAMKRTTRKEQPVTLDLNATYTWTQAGDTTPTTVTPKIRTRTTPDGKHLTIIRGLTPLLADRIDAITDEGDRMHTLIALSGASIVISDQPRSIPVDTRDEGRLAVNYQGTRSIPVGVVLDLAEQLRNAL